MLCHVWSIKLKVVELPIYIVLWSDLTSEIITGLRKGNLIWGDIIIMVLGRYRFGAIWTYTVTAHPGKMLHAIYLIMDIVYSSICRWMKEQSNSDTVHSLLKLWHSAVFWFLCGKIMKILTTSYCKRNFYDFRVYLIKPQWIQTNGSNQSDQTIQ